jgi:hypothetical protein
MALESCFNQYTLCQEQLAELAVNRANLGAVPIQKEVIPSLGSILAAQSSIPL